MTKAPSQAKPSESVSRELERYLPGDLAGAQAVRAQLARRLAAQIDDPATAGYVLPRLAAELRALLLELEVMVPTGDAVEAAGRLMREVARFA